METCHFGTHDVFVAAGAIVDVIWVESDAPG